MCDLLVQTKPLPAGQQEFVDDPRKDVQIVPREGADTAMLLFCAVHHRFGLPLGVLHRWLSAFPASILFLRDFEVRLFMKGIRSLGPDRASSTAALGKILADLGARRILCLGASGGGYGALRYGLDVGAEEVVSFAGPVSMEPAFNAHFAHNAMSEKLRREYPGEELDMRAVYLAAPARPRVQLIYGEHCWDDRLHAEHMADVPGTVAVAIPGHDRHGVIHQLVRRRQFDTLLARLCYGDAV